LHGGKLGSGLFSLVTLLGIWDRAVVELAPALLAMFLRKQLAFAAP